MFRKKNKDDDKEKKPRSVIGEALRIQDVLSMFKYNINPSFIYASVERKTATELKKRSTVEIMWAVFIIIILIGGAVSYMLISNQMACDSCYTELRSCSSGRPFIATQSGSGQQDTSILGTPIFNG